MLTLAPTSAPAPSVLNRPRPLLPVQGVMSLTSLTKEQVIGYIEDGRLLWAWDFMPRKAECVRRLLRVLPFCVDSFLAGQGCPFERLEEVIELMLPRHGAPLRAVDVYRALNVSETFFYDRIIKPGEVKTSKWTTGPFGSPSVERDSLILFLKRCRYPFPER